MNERIEKTIAALKNNNMDAVYLEKKEDVVPFLESAMKDVKTVATGGSATLKECGIIDFLRGGKFTYFDRALPNMSKDEIDDVFQKTFGADCFLTSSNAVTVDGQLYNVDGNGNRVAAIVFGPKKVYAVVGENKIVENIDEAVLRVKTIAAPLNTKRLDCPTYCQKQGHCVADASNFYGCDSDARICCSYLVSGKQRVKNRITVVIVGENLGF